MSSLARLPFTFLVAMSLHTIYILPNPIAPKEERIPLGENAMLIRRIMKAKMILWIAAAIEGSIILARYLWRQSNDEYYLTPLSILAVTMAMGGAYIRHRCYEAMGSMFTIEVSVRKDHKLITHGPYGVVRHPSYTGTFLAAPGGMLWHFTRGSFFRESTTWVAKPLGVVAFAILISAFFILPFRIKKEDELMKEQFGDEWEEWAKKVPYRLVPYVY